MSRTTKNAYDRLKSRTTSKSGVNLDALLKQEETYWIGAAIPAILFAGLLDGGVSIALAYGARKLYEKNNG